MRTVPGVCAAGRDSIPVDPVDPPDPPIVFFFLPFLCFSPFYLGQLRLKILPFLCFTQTNIVRNPALLVFYATQHRPKSCPSCLLRLPKKVPAKKHKKGKQKMGPESRSKIVVFQHEILPFFCSTQNGTAQAP